MDKIILLLSLPGFGLSRVKQFLKENSLLMEDNDYFCYMLSKYLGRSLSVYTDKVKRIKDNCNKLGVKIIRCSNSNIVDAPLILYAAGDTNLLKEERILGIVGTRNPSLNALRLGRDITSHAVSSGWITISGLARGCDTLVHSETVRNGGQTIAVLPKGYAKETAPWIEENGLIISEYPPNTPVRKFRCVRRNRIITGYSKALYVIETKSNGGSMRSVEFAIRKNIPVGFGKSKIYSTKDFDLFLNRAVIV